MNDPAHVLVVCTGNIARSPFAAALLEHEVGRRLASPSDVRVRSAGVHGLKGHPAVAEMIAEARARGVDLTAHRGSPVSSEELRGSDLVLAMTERHRDQLVVLEPEARERVFTFKELARLAPHIEPVPTDVPPRRRLRTLAKRAARLRPYVERPADLEDVADPYGGSVAEYRACAREIADLVTVIADATFGPARGAADGGLLFG